MLWSLSETLSRIIRLFPFWDTFTAICTRTNVFLRIWIIRVYCLAKRRSTLLTWVHDFYVTCVRSFRWFWWSSASGSRWVGSRRCSSRTCLRTRRPLAATRRRLRTSTSCATCTRRSAACLSNIWLRLGLHNAESFSILCVLHGSIAMLYVLLAHTSIH